MPDKQEFHFLTLEDQVTDALRKGMFSGRWLDSLPGRDRLAKEIGVSHKTIEAAMRRLAKEGLLVSQGAGQRRRIVLPKGDAARSHFRLKILLCEPADREHPLCVELLTRLKKVGFAAEFAVKTLVDLGNNPNRVSRFVRKTPADAWVVLSGTHETLKWFSESDLPTFALFGITYNLPIAACGVRFDSAALVKKLVSLGHRKIVQIKKNTDTPGLQDLEFLKALEDEGIETGPYNLPLWGNTPSGLHKCIDTLFKHTAPTAIIVQQASSYLAIRDHLAQKGIHAPRDITLVCLGSDPSFEWLAPKATHYTRDHKKLIRQVMRWSKAVAKGKEDIRQSYTMADFVEGETMGPAPK